MGYQKLKYQCETLRLLGLAMLSPAGKILIDPINFYASITILHSVGITIYATICLLAGLRFIARGFELSK